MKTTDISDLRPRVRGIMNAGRVITRIASVFLAACLIGLMFLGPRIAVASIGSGDNGILVKKWQYSLFAPWSHTEADMFFGSSPAMADLDVNNKGNEPDTDLEIVTGSDEYWNYYPELNGSAYGVWRAFDSSGLIEWASDTKSDEARSSPNIVDIDGDGNLDIVAGTTSGWVVETLERTGTFKWTFPSPPQRNGPFAWHSSPAIADLDPTVSGLEIVIGNTFQGCVYCLDGDNSDGMNDGITADVSWYPVPAGIEGRDWDVLWICQTMASIISTPAIGNIDFDADLEVVIGSDDGNIYCLNGRTGLVEWAYGTGSGVRASPALADFDLDGHSEVVVGSMDGNVYFIKGDENSNGAIDTSEVTFFSTGDAVYSSAALGDVDADGDIEAVVGSSDSNVYSLDYNPSANAASLNWLRTTGGPVVSSPALADRTNVGVLDKEWPMFRKNSERTGFYGPSPPGGLDVYVGSDDSYLYLLDGSTGSIIDRFQTYGAIHTSPSVADVDGDEHLEIAFYDWGFDQGYDDTFWLLRDTDSPGFYLDAIPHENTVTQGQNVTYTVYATSYNNFSDPITFDVLGLPPSAAYLFYPNPASPPLNGYVIVVLNITTTIGTPPGEYLLSIRGISGTKERTVTIALITVTGPDFAVDASPYNIAIEAGQSADFSVRVDSIEGFSLPVTLNVSGTPPDASFSFTANPVTPPPYGTAYSTLTVSTTAMTLPGTYPLYIDGTCGDVVHTIPLFYRTLVVTAWTANHDVAVLDVTTSKTGCLPQPTVGQGYSARIDVTVGNQGDFAETFNLTVYANTLETVIATFTDITLASGNSTILSFAWNTAGFAYGNYTIVAYAWPVENETDIVNNSMVDGVVYVGIPGDVNGDGTVDIYDAILLAGHFNQTPINPLWNANVDINGDNVIDIYDAIILAGHFNQQIP